MGVWHIYPYIPSYQPDAHITLDDINNAVPLLQSPKSLTTTDRDDIQLTIGDVTDCLASSTSYEPFNNAATFLLLKSMYNDSNLRSASQVDTLVWEVILHLAFDTSDLQQFSVMTKLQKLNKFLKAPPHQDNDVFSAAVGWKKEMVQICLLHAGVSLHSENDASSCWSLWVTLGFVKVGPWILHL